MLQRLYAFLKQPYPDKDDLIHNIRGAVLTALIIFFVLYAFQPFNLHQTGNKIGIYALKFGLISGIVTFIFNAFIRYALRIRRDTANWTLWKWISSVTLLILLIAIANYWYITSTFNQAFNGDVFLKVIGSTFLVGIIPVAIFGGYNLSRQLHQFQELASELTPPVSPKPKLTSIELPINKSDNTFPVFTNNILYLEAMQNYVALTYIQDEEQHTELIRNTLSAIEEKLKDSSVKRCHRSFMVNLNYVHQIEGNAQGLKLYLKPTVEKVVPVSRKYIPIFRN